MVSHIVSLPPSGAEPEIGSFCWRRYPAAWDGALGAAAIPVRWIDAAREAEKARDAGEDADMNLWTYRGLPLWRSMTPARLHRLLSNGRDQPLRHPQGGEGASGPLANIPEDPEVSFHLPAKPPVWCNQLYSNGRQRSIWPTGSRQCCFHAQEHRPYRHQLRSGPEAAVGTGGVRGDGSSTIDWSGMRPFPDALPALPEVMKPFP